jgi:hypothetical protein
MACDKTLVCGSVDFHFDARVAASDERAAPVEERDLVLLEQEQDAVIVLLDDSVLATEHLAEVQTEPLDLDAVSGKLMAGVLIVLGGLQQRLGRNAADIGAGATGGGPAVLPLPLVDAGDRKTELRRPDRRNVTTGSAADHDDVEVLRHACLSGLDAGLSTHAARIPTAGRTGPA